MTALLVKHAGVARIARPGAAVRQDGGAEPPAAPIGRLWDVTIIRAGRSLTGESFRPEVLREAVPLWVGAPVYEYRYSKTAEEKAVGADGAHHLPAEVADTDVAKRGLVGDQIGEVTRAWWDETEQAIVGTVAIDDPAAQAKLKSAWDRGAIGKSAEEDAYGFSIFAEAVRSQADPKDVQKIVRGNSLDLVNRPAAGGRFKRLVAEQEDDDVTKEQLEALSASIATGIATQIRQSQTELVAALKPPAPATATAQMAPTPAGAPAAAADPLAGLGEWLRGLTAEARGQAVMKIMETLKGLGATVDMEAQQATVGKLLKELRQASDPSKCDAKELRERVCKLVESLDGASKPADPRDVEIERLRQEHRNMAITAEMARLAPALRLRDQAAALQLADLTGVAVKGTEVSGLRESMEALVKAKPYLLEPEQPAVAATAQGAPAPVLGQGKQPQLPAPATTVAASTTQAAPVLGQAVQIRQSADDGVVPLGMRESIRRLQAEALQGDVTAALKLKKHRESLLKATA